MTKFLLDECMSPRLVGQLWDYGLDTVHVRDRGMLGASDQTVWRYAQDDDRTVCTANAGDFRRLAKSEKFGHSGVLAVSGGVNPAGQLNMVMSALNWIFGSSNTDAGFSNRYIEVDEHGELVLAETHFV